MPATTPKAAARAALHLSIRNLRTCASAAMRDGNTAHWIVLMQHACKARGELIALMGVQ